MTFSDGTIRKVLKLLLKYKLSPEGTIVTGELNQRNWSSKMTKFGNNVRTDMEWPFK